MHLPQVTDREWKLIEPLLPPTGGPGKPRQSLPDRAAPIALRR